MTHAYRRISAITGLFTALAALAAPAAWAQQGVGIGTTTPNPKAALDIQAADKGLLIPRLDSSQRAALGAPPDGLMVFQKDGRVGLWYAFGGQWFYIPDKVKAGDNLGNHTATQPLKLNDQALTNNGTGGLRIDNAGQVGIGTATPTAAQLVVNTTTTATNGLFVGLTGASTASSLKLEHNGSNLIVRPVTAGGTSTVVENTSGGGLVLNPSGGNVGIGVTTPGYLLDIVGSSYLMNRLASSNGAGTWQVLQNTSTGGRNWALISTGSSNGEGPGKLLLRDNTAGQVRMTLSDNGFVGINTVIPDRPLTVQGTGANHDLLSLKNTSGITKWHWNLGGGGLNLAESGVADGRFYVKDGGNVGIGTTNPVERLDLGGNAYVRGGVVVDGNATNDGTTLNMLRFGAGASGEGISSKRTVGGNRFGLDFYTGGLNRLTITNGGLVGFNTTTPRGQFDVDGGGDSYLVDDANNGSAQSVYLPGHLYLAPYSGTGGTAYVQARVPNPGSTTNIGLQLRTTSNGGLVDALYLNPDGKAGIGTVTPDRPLTVQGTGTSSELLSLKNAGGTTKWHLNLINDGLNLAETNATDARLFLKDGGNTGIKTFTPTEALDVNGNLRVRGNALLGYTVVQGDFTLSGNSYTTGTLICPAGYRVMGGGGGHRDYNSAALDIVMHYNGPDITNPETTWRIILENTSGSGRAIRMYCNCARIAP